MVRRQKEPNSRKVGKNTDRGRALLPCTWAYQEPKKLKRGIRELEIKERWTRLKKRREANQGGTKKQVIEAESLLDKRKTRAGDQVTPPTTEKGYGPEKKNPGRQGIEGLGLSRKKVPVTGGEGADEGGRTKRNGKENRNAKKTLQKKRALFGGGDLVARDGYDMRKTGGEKRELKGNASTTKPSWGCELASRKRRKESCTVRAKPGGVKHWA